MSARLASHRLAGIEALRAVAALMVVFYHLVELPKFQIPESIGIIKTHFGFGVPLFYALSGFVLAFGYAEKLHDRPSVLHYLLRRLFRIAPLFYSMLAAWMALMWFKYGKLESLSDVFLNAMFLFGLVPGKHEGIVWAGWSIGIEMQFYLVFPVLVTLVAGAMSGSLAWLIAAFTSAAAYKALEAAGMGSYAYMNLITHLPFFIAGLLAYRLWERSDFRHSRLKGALLLLGAAVATVAMLRSPAIYLALFEVRWIDLHRNAWALVFIAVILGVCYWPQRLLVNRVTTFLGKISFSLYLLHPLLIFSLMELGVYDSVFEFAGPGWRGGTVVVLITLGLLVSASAVTFRVIELPGMAYGKRLGTRCLKDELKGRDGDKSKRLT